MSDLGPARIASTVVGLMLIALVALLAFSGGETDDGPTGLLGQRAPEVAGTTLDGQSYDLDDRRGSWVVVNFFATWCPGCVNEHDDLIALEEWGATRGDLEVVAVVFDDEVDFVEQFFDQRGGDWPVLNNPDISVDYRVSQIPETFLVSPSGQVVVHVAGEVDAAEMIRQIEELG